MKKLMVYLLDDQYQALRKESFDTGLSMSEIVRRALGGQTGKKGTRGFEKIVKGGKPVNYTSRGSGKTTDAKLNPKQPFDFSMDRKKK